MIKRTFTFETLDGETVSEEYLFNLTKSELRELYYEREGGTYAYAQSLVSSSDAGKALQLMIDLVMHSVGVRSEDGRRIEKNDKVRKNFKNSPAYDQLMTEIFDDNKFTEFLEHVIPRENAEAMLQALKEAEEKEKESNAKKPAKKKQDAGADS